MTHSVATNQNPKTDKLERKEPKHTTKENHQITREENKREEWGKKGMKLIGVRMCHVSE